MDQRVDEYIAGLTKWQEEIKILRGIFLASGLQEDFKWKHPCYTLDGKNIAILQDFKDYGAVMFTKGSLFQDLHKVLFKLNDQVQAYRQVRFTTIEEVQNLHQAILDLIAEAVEVEKAGLKPKLKETSDYEFPEELISYFEDNESFHEAFNALTPGRQRGYLLHFAGAKQAATRLKRIQDSVARISKGFGIDDCVCGRSKRMPRCDGSHKC